MHFPFVDVLHDVSPLAKILHGEEDGFVDELVVLFGLGGQQVEELLDGIFGIVFVAVEDVRHQLIKFAAHANLIRIII